MTDAKNNAKADIKTDAPPPSPTPSATSSPAVQTLQEAAAGLLFPSETDAAIEPFFWLDDKATDDKATADKAPTLTPEAVARLAGAPADALVKSVKLETFFKPATTEEDWHNDEEQAQVKRFQELVKTIKSTLSDVKVFRVGDTSVDVYIVGKVEGGYAGLRTKVVET